MGKPYRRPDSPFWWIAYLDSRVNAKGKRKRVCISAETTDEAEAAALQASIERRVAADLQSTGPGAWTVARYVEEVWLPARTARGVATVRRDKELIAHALPIIGHLGPAQVKKGHIKAIIRDMSQQKEADGLTALFAPRTVLHVYGALRILFGDLLDHEPPLIPVTPCTLKERRGELPAKVDKDPSWRAKAVFTRDEAEQIISDPRIPEYRRVLWTCLFLGGFRINEATPRRWSQYDAAAEPLGKLEITTHYRREEAKEVPGTKTGPGRDIPVHPTLARVLASWRLKGWAAYQGRQPGPDDLIIPGVFGGILNSDQSEEWLHEDLEALGLRKRGQHCARATFITLSRLDGARDAFLKWVSHGPSKATIMDHYTRPPWPELCADVAKLKIRVKEGKVVRLAASMKSAASQAGSAKSATLMLRSEKREQVPGFMHGRGGNRTRRNQALSEVSARQRTEVVDLVRAGIDTKPTRATPQRSNVATPSSRAGFRPATPLRRRLAALLARYPEAA